MNNMHMVGMMISQMVTKFGTSFFVRLHPPSLEMEETEGSISQLVQVQYFTQMKMLLLAFMLQLILMYQKALK